MINSFDKGLNLRLAEHLVPAGYAREFTNVDYESGILQPVKDKVSVAAASGAFAFYSDALAAWRFTPVKYDYVDQYKKLIYTDRTTGLRWTNGTLDVPLGLAAPTGVAEAQATPVGVESHATEVNDNSSRALSASAITATAQTVAGITFIDDAIAAGQANLEYAAVPVLYTTFGGVSFPMRGTAISRSIPVGATGGLGLYYHVGVRAGMLYRVDPAVGDVYATDWELYRQLGGRWYLIGSIQANIFGDYFADTEFDLPAIGRTPVDYDLFAPAGFSGVYQYYLTSYDPVTGFESPPIKIADIDTTETVETLTGTGGFPTVTVTWDYALRNGVLLSDIPVSTNAQASKKRLYRLGGNITALTLVAELDNAIAVHSDTLGDSAIDGTLLASTNTLPVTTLKYLIEHQTHLMAADGSKVRYSLPAQAHVWPTTHYIEFTKEVTGVCSTVGGVLVFTAFETYVITGSTHETFSKRRLCSDIGCVSHDSIQTTSGTAVWASDNGLFTSAGATPKSLTRQLLGVLDTYTVDSALVDQRYYLNNSVDILCVDFQFNVVSRVDPTVASLAVKNGALFGVSSGFLWELFAAATPLPMQYLSPTVASSGKGQAKVFRRVKVTYTGVVTITVYIDGVTTGAVQLAGSSVDYVNIPAAYSRGGSYAVGVGGTGMVYELAVEEASANV